MKNNFKSLLLSILAAGIFSVIGCSKSSELGLSLVEKEQSDILTSDTFGVVLMTNKATPTETYGRTQMVCGHYEDADWGSSTASVYMNFRLPSTNATFPNSRFDSLVLTLAYENFGHYAELRNTKPTTNVQSWDVLRLATNLVESEAYKSDASITTGDILKAGFQFRPNDTAKVTIGSTTYDPHIRIRLDDPSGIALGQSLLTGDTAIFASNANFKNWIKGVKVRPTPGYNNTAIVRLRAKNALTKLTLYYTDTVGTDTPKSFDFLTNEDAEMFTAFEHGITTFTDTLLYDTLDYIKGLDGLHTKVSFPNVRSLSNVIINKAELVFMVADTGSIQYPTPVQIVAKIKDSQGNLVVIDDVATSLIRSQSYLLFGGYREEINNTKTYLYRIHLAEEMQNIVDNETYEAAIYLTMPSALDPERVKLHNHHSALKPKLYLTYTKLK